MEAVPPLPRTAKGDFDMAVEAGSSHEPSATAWGAGVTSQKPILTPQSNPRTSRLPWVPRLGRLADRWFDT